MLPSCTCSITVGTSSTIWFHVCVHVCKDVGSINSCTYILYKYMYVCIGTCTYMCRFQTDLQVDHQNTSVAMDTGEVKSFMCFSVQHVYIYI